MILKNAFLHLKNGQTVQGDLQIENGKLAAVGGTLHGDEERDYTGKHIYPGAIAICAPGTEETTDPILPAMDAWYGLTACELKSRGFVQKGVTSVVAVPGEHNVISGLCAVVKTWGSSMEGMTVRRGVAMKGAFTDAVVATYRPAGMAKAPLGPAGMTRKLQHALSEREELAPVSKGELPLLMTCRYDFEVRRVLDALKDLPELKLIFTGCPSDEKLAQELSARGAELVCGCGGTCPRHMAELFGVSDRVGQLAVGLDADLAVYAGEGRKALLETFVCGESVYQA